MNGNARVCEMCLEAASEEAMAEASEYELLCVTLGSEIGDHLCEEIEIEGVTRCRCSCQESTKVALRRDATVRGGRS